MRSKETETKIGRRLGALRARRGLSQGTVARMSGIAPSYLSRVESGKVQPTFPTLWRIMSALRADFAELLGPESAKESRRGGCPVSGNGQCLLDLLRSEQEVAQDPTRKLYTAREVRFLGRVSAWMKRAPADRLRALETILDAFERELD